MPRLRYFAVFATILVIGAAWAVDADTVLVLQNGAEARGKFVGMKDGNYELELVDGRRVTYPLADVVEMRRIEGDESAPPPLNGPAVANICRGTLLFTESSLPKDLYTVIREVEVSQKGIGYDRPEIYFDDLAREAKALGGDAVLSVRTWRAVSGWSWSAPHVGGLVVRWTEKASSVVVDVEKKCM